MVLRIRPATPADADAVVALHRQCAAFLTGLGDPTIFRFDKDAYLRDGFGAQAAFGGLVAERAGPVVGYLLHHSGYDVDRVVRQLWVADLYVADHARQSGVGRALMAAAADVCRQQGGTELVWSVYRPNRQAFAFFERLGARHVDDLQLMSLPVPEVTS